ncbi:hypothetical protein LshimejAT787_2001140 [Lyophyllum shimeji]|uniref:Uncharacterized protein n=1 Tax=Lyophyllum shimeji TaxID=47721 RepID=A0A9P3Q186_LYOSH|nr:hypothetical protein LshimejAT787_2001140 [Lyophyllum shimeji]
MNDYIDRSPFYEAKKLSKSSSCPTPASPGKAQLSELVPASRRPCMQAMKCSRACYCNNNNRRSRTIRKRSMRAMVRGRTICRLPVQGLYAIQHDDRAPEHTFYGIFGRWGVRAHGWHPRWLEALSRPSPAPRTSPPASPTSLESPRRRPDPRISTSVFAPPAGFTTSTSSSAAFLSQYQVGPGSPMASSVSGPVATPPGLSMHAGQGVLAHQQVQSFLALRQQAEAWAWQGYSHAGPRHLCVDALPSLEFVSWSFDYLREEGDALMAKFLKTDILHILSSNIPSSTSAFSPPLVPTATILSQGSLSSKLQVFRTPWFPELLLQGQTMLTDDYVGRHLPYKAD